jgi:hypothetical protein
MAEDVLVAYVTVRRNKWFWKINHGKWTSRTVIYDLDFWKGLQNHNGVSDDRLVTVGGVSNEFLVYYKADSRSNNDAFYSY